MKFKYLLSVSLAVMLFGLFSLSANAKASCRLGEIIFLSGSGFLERNAEQSELATGKSLCTNDKIITGPDSVAELELRDGSKITIGKDSELVIKKYQISRQLNVALFELTKGTFRAVTGRITNRPHRFEVKTAEAVIGALGTDFWGGYGLTENGLDVLMFDGKGIYVKNNKDETVEINKPNLGTTILQNKPPSFPEKWDEAKVAKALATITP